MLPSLNQPGKCRRASIRYLNSLYSLIYDSRVKLLHSWLPMVIILPFSVVFGSHHTMTPAKAFNP